MLVKSFQFKIRARFGIGCEMKGIRILNRMCRVTDAGLEYEVDPRHVELLVESLAIANASPINSPGLKAPDPSVENPEKINEPATTMVDAHLPEEVKGSTTPTGDVSRPDAAL